MSGGFYRYHCKYFYTHNCPHWVWVNNTPCANCSVSEVIFVKNLYGLWPLTIRKPRQAEGRDAAEDSQLAQNPGWRLAREVFVPHILDGFLHYTLMEIVATGEGGSQWMLRQKRELQPSGANLTTSAVPRSVFQTTGISTQLVTH